jgi:large subunit ribosomal protein L6
VSRIGKTPIQVPAGVTVKIDGHAISAKGPKGELALNVHPEMLLKMEDGKIVVERPSNEKMHRSLHGLSRTLIANIIEGVTKGYEKKLEIIGVGYRAEMKGKKLFLTIGYSHPILFVPPDEIQIATEGNNIVVVRGIRKELVGQVAAKIRFFKPPEPYKGKGIRYVGEYVRKKAGKTAA